ncbi:hypothetical protein LTR36_008393 [Oleoguttula mirabilis]|uniref:Uncharacterized protein n=1 Tax=Oleoguttula mirabilis TaxID=1507867 RepID=A0AAV9J866_9PEZI|nr:hypothetical protein LTR36_008393 [Oleoguttula mirabilis]
MTSLLARLGQREVRTATPTLWSSGKRKRQDWVCKECRATKVVVQQRRGHGDDRSRLPADQYMFPTKELREDGENKRMNNRIAEGRGKAQPQFAHRDRWESSRGDDRVRVRSLAGALADTGDNAEARKDGAMWSAQDGDRTSPQESAQNSLWERFEQVQDDATDTEVTEVADDSDRTAPQDDAQNALWERSEQVEDDETITEADQVADDFAVDTSARTFGLHAERDASLLNLDYAAKLPEALLKCEVDMVARCLLAASQANDLEFIRSLDEATFSQVLDVMEPVNSIDKLASAHLEISNAMVRQLGIASMQKIAWEYYNLLMEIVAIRRSAGIKLSRANYAVLLRGARDLGNRVMAGELWRKLQRDGNVPDVECYNYYMAVVVFERQHNASARHKLRIIPFHMLARKSAYRGDAFRGYRVGGDGGVKAKVVGAFGHMLKSGVVANEESFWVVIMAAAREGEMSTVKAVLRKVWSIDVDALVAGKDAAEIRPKELERSSHLYPTSNLLFAIAHAFGINNDIPTALRIVDLVARHYKLTISQEVWSQLFEWTFVLASPRTGAKSRVDGTKTGQLPLQSVMNLWETMTGAPYLVQPTMGMYNRLIKNLFSRDKTPLVIEKMEEGRRLYHDSSIRAKQLWTALESDIILFEHNPSVVDSLEHSRDDWEHAELIRKRNLFWLKRWLRLLLATMRSRVGIDMSADWSFRHIPRLLWEWRHYAPRHVSYETAGGIVEFDIRSQEDIDAQTIRAAGWKVNQLKVLGRLPKYVGHRWLTEGMRLLPIRMVASGGTGSTVPVPAYLQRRLAADLARPQRGNDDNPAPEDLRQQVRDAVDEALDRR